jgi:hypothetical protein
LEAFHHGAGTGHLPSPFYSDVYSKTYQFSCNSSFPNALRLSVGLGAIESNWTPFLALLRPIVYDHGI